MTNGLYYIVIFLKCKYMYLCSLHLYNERKKQIAYDTTLFNKLQSLSSYKLIESGLPELITNLTFSALGFILMLATSEINSVKSNRFLILIST